MRDFLFFIAKHSFYLVGMFFIFYELNWLIGPADKTESNRKHHELSKGFKGKKWDDYSQEYKDSVKKHIWGATLFLWLFFGLFTFQWFLFLALIVFEIIIMAPLMKATRFSLTYTVIGWLNALICLFFGVFIIVNSYHLKLDWNYFRSFLNF